MPARWRLELEYDGSEFCGWQRQLGRRTVQGVLERAVAEVTGQMATVVGAGRTDAGVHASGQVAHVDVTWQRAVSELQRGLNARLPGDVAVVAMVEAPADFHARHSARARCYEYWLWNGPVRPVLARRTHWHVAAPLDTEVMAQAARAFVGEHDFGAFGRPPTANGSTVRRVTACAVERRGDRVVIRVAGNAFLRGQVRRMVGCLVDIGRGRSDVAVVEALLRRRAGAPRPRLAPAHGLILVAVDYAPPEDRRPRSDERREG